MNFYLIDQHLLQCIINKEELIDRDISPDDFAKGNSNAKDFIYEMVTTAYLQYGYKPEGNMLQIDVLNCKEDDTYVEIIICDGTAEDMTELIKKMSRRRALNITKSIKSKDYKWSKWDYLDQVGQSEEGTKNKRPGVRPSLYWFDDFDPIMEFAVQTKADHLKSVIYNSPKKGYYLFLAKGRCSLDDYIAACELCKAYGTLVERGEDEVKARIYNQNCVIPKDAIGAMRKLYDAIQKKEE